MQHNLMSKQPEVEAKSGSVGKRPSLPRIAAILAGGLFLALPIVYLMMQDRPMRSVSAKDLPQSAQSAPATSIPQLEGLVRSNPTAENRINLSLAFINGNQPGRAIPLLTAIVAEDKNNALAWNNLCVANTMQMAYNLALEECNNAIRIAPALQIARNNLKWAEDENKKALAALAAQEQVAPASRDANSYLAEGLNFLHVGNYDQAIKAWQRSLTLNPQDAGAANNIGIAYMSKRQPVVAASWFEKAISMDPGMELAKNNLAWAKEEAAKEKK